LLHGGPAVARAFLEEFALIAARIAEDPRSFQPWPHQRTVRSLTRMPSLSSSPRMVSVKGSEIKEISERAGAREDPSLAKRERAA
jgi:hypothetical protein